MNANAVETIAEELEDEAQTTTEESKPEGTTVCWSNTLLSSSELWFSLGLKDLKIHVWSWCFEFVTSMIFQLVGRVKPHISAVGDLQLFPWPPFRPGTTGHFGLSSCATFVHGASSLSSFLFVCFRRAIPFCSRDSTAFIFYFQFCGVWRYISLYHRRLVCVSVSVLFLVWSSCICLSSHSNLRRTSSDWSLLPKWFYLKGFLSMYSFMYSEALSHDLPTRVTTGIRWFFCLSVRTK